MEINTFLEKKLYKDVDVLLPYPDEEDIVPIATAIKTITNVIKLQIDNIIFINKVLIQLFFS